MMRTSTFLALVALAAFAVPADAGHHRKRAGCDDCCAPACQPKPCHVEYKTVNKTVMVPSMQTVMREVCNVVCRPVEYTKKCMVLRHVPVVRDVEYTYVVPRFETRTRTVRYSVCKPVTKTRSVECTVMVPHEETRKTTRTVCRMVPVTVKRTICEDHGHWKEVPCDTGCNKCSSNVYRSAFQNVGFRHGHGRGRGCCESSCGDCAAPCCPHKVWVPKMVNREVSCTVMRMKMEHVPSECTVVCYRPETRTRQVKTCHMVYEPRSREVTYKVCVPERKTGVRQVTSYRCEEVAKDIRCTKMVSEVVRKQVPVQVCKMVPKTVACRVAVCVCN